jgi:hypothetical protein
VQWFLNFKLVEFIF